ncbi:MAG: hypothetical protein Q9184_003531 [Pyrenodesmia sp. 2 TL-2023]
MQSGRRAIEAPFERLVNDYPSIPGWNDDDNSFIVGCKKRIRGSTNTNIAKVLSHLRGRAIDSEQVRDQLGQLSKRFKYGEMAPYLPSNTPRVENPHYYWTILWSDREERRTHEHEIEISKIKVQYDWVLSQCEDLGCQAYGGSEGEMRIQPLNPVQLAAVMPEPTRSEIMEHIIEPLYRSSLACLCSGGWSGGKHKQVSHLGSRVFCLHPWPTNRASDKDALSGDMETIIFLRLGYGTPISWADIAKTLTFAWSQIHERLPWEDAREFEAGQVEEVIRADERVSSARLSDYKHAADPLRAYVDSRWLITRATATVRWKKGLIESLYKIAIGEADETAIPGQKEPSLTLQKAKAWMKKASGGIGSSNQQSRGYRPIAGG